MAVKDGERFVGEAMASVVGQTFRDMEIIVVDDGSTDRTSAILDGFDDGRVVRVQLARNVGQPSALNLGLQRATGEFVARMDGDDVSMPDRIRQQVASLEARHHIGLLGTRITPIDESGSPTQSGFDPPAGEALVLWNLLQFTNPLAHSSVMFRRELVERVGVYDPAMGPAEDRDLWSRMADVTRIDVLPEPLIRFRLHDASLSARNQAVQREKSLGIRRRMLARFLGGDDPGRAIDAWYAPSLTEEQMGALSDLFLRVFHGMCDRGRWSRDDLDPVRADLCRRLESLRRRDARLAPRRGPVSRLLRRLRSGRVNRSG